MSDAPERIWAWNFIPEKQDDVIKGGWDDVHDRKSVEYIRADLVHADAELAKMHHAEAFGAGVDLSPQWQTIEDSLPIMQHIMEYEPTTAEVACWVGERGPMVWMVKLEPIEGSNRFSVTHIPVEPKPPT